MEEDNSGNQKKASRVGAHSMSGEDKAVEGKLRPSQHNRAVVGAHSVKGPDKAVEGKLRPSQHGSSSAAAAASSVGAHSVQGEDTAVQGKMRAVGSSAVGAQAVKGPDKRVEGKMRPVTSSVQSQVGAQAVKGPDKAVEGKLRPSSQHGSGSSAVGAQAVTGSDKKVQGKMRAASGVGVQAVKGPDKQVQGKLRAVGGTTSAAVAAAGVGVQAVKGPDREVEGKLRAASTHTTTSSAVGAHSAHGPDERVAGKLRPAGLGAAGVQAVKGPDERVAGKLRPAGLGVQAVKGVDERVAGKLRPAGAGTAAAGAEAVKGLDSRIDGKLRSAGASANNISTQNVTEPGAAPGSAASSQMGKLRVSGEPMGTGAHSVVDPNNQQAKGLRGRSGVDGEMAPGALTGSASDQPQFGKLVPAGVGASSDSHQPQYGKLVMSNAQQMSGPSKTKMQTKDGEYSQGFDVDMVENLMSEDAKGKLQPSFGGVEQPGHRISGGTMQGDLLTGRMEAPANPDNLAVARAVEEDDDYIPADLPKADGYDPEAQENRIKAVTKRNRCYMFAGLVLIGVVGLIIGLTVNKGETVEATAAPSQSPSMAPTSFAEGFLWSLPDSTQKAIAESEETPQARAYNWIVNDAALPQYPDWRVIQRFALATFYYATKGEDWYVNTNWLEYGVHECDWPNANNTEGIIELWGPNLAQPYALYAPGGPCDLPQYMENETDHNPETFLHLWLEDNGLSGTVPAQLGLLTGLRTLTLEGSSKKLKGPIPSEIGLLTKLVGSAWSFSDLSGTTLPTELGQCTDLNFWASAGCDLDSSLPTEIGLCRSLESLLIGDNEFMTGTIPTEIGLLTSLAWLYATRAGTMAPVNGFGGAIPSEFGVLTLMTDLNLGRNHFTGTLPTEIGNLYYLGYLQLNSNDLTGPIPSELGAIRDTFWLNFNKNRMTGTLPTELGNLSQMYFFNPSRNDFTGTIPTEYGSFGAAFGMLGLRLHDTLLTGTIPSELGLMGSGDGIGHLHFEETMLSGTIPVELEMLVDLGLFDVKLFNTSLTGVVPGAFCHLGTPNCTDCRLEFDCSITLCGCDCACSDSTSVNSTSNQ